MQVEVHSAPSEDTTKNRRSPLLSTRSKEDLPVGH